MDPSRVLRDVSEEFKVLYVPLVVLLIVLLISLGGWTVVSFIITSIPQEQMGLYVQGGSSTDIYTFLEKMDLYKQIPYLEPSDEYTVFLRLCSAVITEYYLSKEEGSPEIVLSCNGSTIVLNGSPIKDVCDWLYKLPKGSECVILE